MNLIFVPRHQFEADEGMVFLQIEADGRRYTVYVADCLIDDLTGMGDDNGTYTEALVSPSGRCRPPQGDTGCCHRKVRAMPTPRQSEQGLRPL